ncbi:hypothetical protein DST85_06205, partial [Campylobacter coli]|nr:hypothetical protein [Campylobacter coli]
FHNLVNLWLRPYLKIKLISSKNLFLILFYFSMDLKSINFYLSVLLKLKLFGVYCIILEKLKFF